MPDALEPAAGRFLVAEPALGDPNFNRTIVLICQHDENAGSFGLVLTRPLDIRLPDVLIEPAFPGIDVDLYQGGPVQLDTLHYLHPHGDIIEGSLPVTEGIYWGGEFEEVVRLIDAGDVSLTDFRFFLGYSGWDAGQIEEEVAEGSWIVFPASAELVFATEPQSIWRKLLRSLGGEYALLSNFPDDPRMN
jgi:putative transcriptional regulator